MGEPGMPSMDADGDAVDAGESDDGLDPLPVVPQAAAPMRVAAPTRARARRCGVFIVFMVFPFRERPRALAKARAEAPVLGGVAGDQVGVDNGIVQVLPAGRIVAAAGDQADLGAVRVLIDLHRRKR